MIVHIVRDAGFVAAMGHRVALHLGGEPELKRRVLQTLAQLDAPPDDIQFRRVGPTDEEPEPAAPAPPERAALAEEPQPEREPPAPTRGKPPPRRDKRGKAA